MILDPWQRMIEADNALVIRADGLVASTNQKEPRP